MIANVKKSNFFIYLICSIVGITLIVIAILIFPFCSNVIWDELLLSVGCSTIPTVATAYLIDRASEKRNIKKRKELRRNFMWGIPNGVLWIMKVIVESYCPHQEKEESFLVLFKEAISIMKNTPPNSHALSSERQTVNELFYRKNMNYGITLCEQSCKTILDNSCELELEEVFTKSELLTIESLYEDVQILPVSYVVNELGEYIETIVDNMMNSFTEIKEKAIRTIEIHNGIVKKWSSLTK